MIKALTSSKKVYCPVYFLLTILSVVLIPAQAGQLSVQFDNDGLFTSDGNYTNGFSLAWESKALRQYHQHLSSSMPIWLQWQHGMRFPVNKNQTAWGVKVSQRMWTPNDIGKMNYQSNDRPYVGLVELESHTANYSPNFAQKNWLAVGVIGPKARAEKIQTKVHQITGSTIPQGWQYQVEEQVTAQFAYEVDSLWYRKQKYQGTYFTDWQWEVSGFSHISLGNLNTQASLGFLFRWGTMLANTFGRLSNHFGHIGNITQALDGSNLTTFARLGLGYRFNDLSIEGSLPYESSVELKNTQAKACLGFTWTQENFALTWSLNGYTRAYHSDIKPWHTYGSLTLSASL
ncbi:MULTISPECIES: lipid A deacylase LpxR family protein [Colwellia]|uniref:Exonuclease n=1 Tax=Colwellia marinimaniae TaxID=1513592 RepID=A0ABQ0MZS0_9GAMM|nr:MULTISPECIES: lipid A deacylase LpxR family protein [Colwellia]GAW97863.1 exonuclease [Colwellia marinimaniae]